MGVVCEFVEVLLDLFIAFGGGFHQFFTGFFAFGGGEKDAGNGTDGGSENKAQQRFCFHGQLCFFSKISIIRGITISPP